MNNFGRKDTSSPYGQGIRRIRIGSPENSKNICKGNICGLGGAVEVDEAEDYCEVSGSNPGQEH
jgi:hypothetical protein